MYYRWANNHPQWAEKESSSSNGILIEGSEWVLGGQNKVFRLTIDDLPLGWQAVEGWKEAHPSSGLLPEALALAGSLRSSADLQKILDLAKQIRKEDSPGSLFKSWLISVGGRPGIGIFQTVGEDPMVTINFVKRLIVMTVRPDVAGRWIGTTGFRINALNAWMHKLGWHVKVESSPSANWGEVKIIEGGKHESS